MKHSEAKIIIFLHSCNKVSQHPKAISAGIGMDYSYCINILARMIVLKWIKKISYNSRKTHYFTTDTCPTLEEASTVHVQTIRKQKELIRYGN